MKLKNIALIVICLPSISFAQTRWNLNDKGIRWEIQKNDIHKDHIEMSGEQVAAVIRYSSTSNGDLNLSRSVVFPTLRTLPNDTHASLNQRFSFDIKSYLTINQMNLENENFSAVQLDGMIHFDRTFSIANKNIGAARNIKSPPIIHIKQTIFPSMKNRLLAERYELTNISKQKININIPALHQVLKTDASKGVDGSYQLITTHNISGNFQLLPNESKIFYIGFIGLKSTETLYNIDFEAELAQRNLFLKTIHQSLQLKTPNDTINRMFEFSKIRSTESIFRTKGGLMHGPGGESYYAAIWANDEAEYVNPFFPFIDYSNGHESAFNSFKHFARFMNKDFKPIPSSIIAEGLDFWNGAGDRGDAAMIAYGAARYALSRAQKSEANELWPLIKWCLEFCKRKITKEGVVASDSDELEGRFPAGKANLSTSCLYYDALISASCLAKEIGEKPSLSKQYLAEAAAIKKAINTYFSSKISGFDTYRYYDGNTLLRSWICMPLTVGIFDKSVGTIDALLSEKLFTQNGLLTQEGSETFWDRSTLYALRGILYAGKRQEGISYLQFYSAKRLLGDHVPYAIEAWPEGSQRHLSAESGLYARVITEGLFGIRPTGFHSFSLKPQLPSEWDYMSLKNIAAFGGHIILDIVRKSKDDIQVSIATPSKHQKFTIKNGAELKITL